MGTARSHTPCFVLSVYFVMVVGGGAQAWCGDAVCPLPLEWSQAWLISRVPGLAGSQAYLSPLSDWVTRSSLALADRQGKGTAQ